MRTPTLVTLLSAPLLLAACGSGDESEQMEDMSAEGHDMSMMETETATKMATGLGVVTAIDSESGTITIDHEPVPALEWPEMVMAFEANEQIRREVAVGDEISFEFNSGSEGNVITSVATK